MMAAQESQMYFRCMSLQGSDGEWYLNRTFALNADIGK
jgi:hypothetical protein